MPKEKTFYQIYELHLINGEVVELPEEYDLPFEKGFVTQFEKADDNHLFVINDCISGSIYVPKKNIVYVKAGDVKEGTTWK